MNVFLLGLFLVATARAGADDGAPPARTIPPSVLAEVQGVNDRFELALATDCTGGRCYSKGCRYVSHAVADRRATTSMPGLGAEPGPGAVEAQAWLTGTERGLFAGLDSIANLFEDGGHRLCHAHRSRVEEGPSVDETRGCIQYSKNSHAARVDKFIIF